MNIKKLEQRNSSMDILRIVAVFTVLSVHFFLHNGFYSEPVTGLAPIEGIIDSISTGNGDSLHGPLMFLALAMRTLFSVCVPLFMILTGYLMSRKELKKGYYKGIRKTVIVFILATFACMIFKSVHEIPAAKEAFYSFNYGAMFEAISQSGKYNFINYLFSILDFTGANYSWYIEMYIGMFLIAPFLNLAYNKLGSKKHKQILVVTMVCLTILPTMLNIFNFQSAQWWVTPTSSDEFQKLVPAYWMGLYPLTYYFVGAYLREYGLRLKTGAAAALFAGTLLASTVFNWFRSYGGGFKTGIYGFWYGFYPFVLSVLLFLLISRIKTENWKPSVKLALWRVSDLALGIYLCSFIFDSLIYYNLNLTVPVMVDRIPYYLLTVPASFLCSALLSFVLDVLAKLIIRAYEKIKVLVCEQIAAGNFMRWQDLLFAALMCFGVILSIWKLRYGFGGSDEAFYLTVPHRLSLGDALFTDEWHVSQLSGFLLIPFVSLFRLITGSTDGIMIAARVLYLVLHTGAAVLIYTRLRKYGILSVFGCALYFLYTPYNIMALSYNTMGIELLLVAGVLLATADYKKKLLPILSGLAFAGAVLCNPYLIVCFFLYGACVGVHYAIKKKEMRFVLKSEMFSLRTFLFFTAGAACLAVVFLIFTLTRTGLGDIFANIPEMLKDPEHPSIPFGRKVETYFQSIFDMTPHFKYVLYGYFAMLAFMIFDRKRRLHRAVYLCLSCAATGISLIMLLPGVTSTTYNHIMLPMLFLGITSYILIENKPRELFAAVFVTGLIYSFCIHYGSNQMIYCIASVMVVANVASFIFLGRLIKEMRETPDNLTYAAASRILSFILVGIIIAFQGGAQITAKTYHVFWDSAPDALTAEIKQGPASGIVTTDANLESYNNMYTDMVAFQMKEPGNILFMSFETWPYLAMNDFPYGTFSAWTGNEQGEGTLSRMRTYYEMNPEKTPKYIYIPKSAKWNVSTLLPELQSKGYTLTETNVSYQLEKK
ncbi:acyltransferase [Lachnoclostridium sp. MSJ-17]|uniref:acyltransferase n=1 Tax=Lachnoclostridium sp. MSJ-17 TaxID=2841516 RepID=UPI001C1025B8|nr:acyltransferase family protein [Lachnoclostridium sp. MSJ-17]MBU5461744.1 acyltransferase family protein [Lachnoclostridium sp. MSJ-17]